MVRWVRVILAIVLVLALLFAIGFTGFGGALMICGLSVCGIESMGMGLIFIIGGVGMCLLVAHYLIRTLNGGR